MSGITFDRRLISWAAVVALAAVVFYLNAFGNELVLDDLTVIRDNPNIRSIGGALDAFTTSYRGVVDDGLYRPLTVASFALNYAISGLATWSYTLGNLICHAAVAIALFLLARSLGAPMAAAGVAGILFGVHPVHTESVTGFAGRGELLVALFFLLSLLVHRAIPGSGNSMRLRLVAWGAFLLALLSKESAITLLGVLPAMDLLVPSQDARGSDVGLVRRIRGDYSGYVAVAVFYFVIRAAALGGSTLGVQVMPLDNPMTTTTLVTPLGNTYGASAVESLMTPVAVVAEYARLLVWPARLSADYSYNQIPLTSSLADPRVLVGLAVISATLAGVVLLRRRMPIAAFGLVFMAISFSLTSNFVIKIGAICAERLIYLPSAGFVLALATLWGGIRGTRQAWRAPLGWVLLLAVALPAGARTWTRNPDWHDELSLWTSAVQAVSNSAKAHSNYGNFSLREARALRVQGKTADAEKRFREARTHLERALEILPDYPEATISLGNLLAERGNYSEAETMFDRAILLAPDFPRGYTNRAVLAIRRLDEVRARSSQFQAQGRASEAATLDARAAELTHRALRDLDRAIELQPTTSMAWFNRGILYQKHLGQPARAASDFRRFLALRPDHPLRAELEREISLLEN